MSLTSQDQVSQVKIDYLASEYYKEVLFAPPDSGLLPFFRDESLDRPLCLLVILHEDHIEKVEAEHEEGLPPLDVVVHEEEDECDERDAVEGAVPEEWPPGEVEDCFAEESAHANHEEDVEDSGAYDGSDADI